MISRIGSGPSPAERGAEHSPRVSRRSWLLLTLILLIGLELRVYRLDEVPAGIYCDEAALGYNAYAIGEAGIDENGVSWPLFVRSFGGYKNPVYIYAAMLPVKLFGLSEFSLRLTSAIFGVLTLLGLFWLGTELWGTRAGLIAAALLCITPWHLHFSRIAFELISFPCLFVFGFAFLVRAVRRGGLNWVGAGAMFGLALYSYAIALLVVPSFLLVFLLLFFRPIWRMKGSFVWGFLLFLFLCLPVANFRIAEPTSTQYFQGTTWIQSESDLEDKAATLWRHYQSFFSYRFLFESGDPLIRHSAPGHGELHKTLLPFALTGLIFLLLPPTRFNLLLLLWVALYPLGASLMNEIPSATRAFIGSPLAPLLAAFSFHRFGDLLSRSKPALLKTALPLLLFLVATLGLVYETVRYLQIYYGPFQQASARGYGGFQFGYRDVIQYMEDHRDSHSQRLLTASMVNQPWIFVNFYTGTDPRRWSSNHQNGYRILVPQEYGLYNLDEPTLYSLRASELSYFEDFTVKKEVVAPDGEVEFVVAEVRKRKDFLTHWSTRGLFRNRSPRALSRSAPRIESDSGVEWRPMRNQYITLDFNRFYAAEADGNPERCCAEAVTYVRLQEDPLEAQLEVFGSDDPLALWVNGSLVMNRQKLSPQLLVEPVTLAPGWSEISIRSCESIGDWFVAIRLSDAEGKSLAELQQRNSPNESITDWAERRAQESAATPGKADASAFDGAPLIEGFSGIVRSNHRSPEYPGHRGNGPSFWAYHRVEKQEVVWRAASHDSNEARVYAFTASSGEDPGTALLSIDGTPRLRFQTGVDEGVLSWSEAGVHLEFFPVARVGGLSGYYLFSVPAGIVPANSEPEFSVSFLEGGSVTWFMIKGYQDTLAQESLF